MRKAYETAHCVDPAVQFAYVGSLGNINGNGAGDAGVALDQCQQRCFTGT
jgi:hypothetical protein